MEITYYIHHIEFPLLENSEVTMLQGILSLQTTILKVFTPVCESLV